FSSFFDCAGAGSATAAASATTMIGVARKARIAISLWRGLGFLAQVCTGTLSLTRFRAGALPAAARSAEMWYHLAYANTPSSRGAAAGVARGPICRFCGARPVGRARGPEPVRVALRRRPRDLARRLAHRLHTYLDRRGEGHLHVEPLARRRRDRPRAAAH